MSRDWQKDMERAKLMSAAGEYEGWTEPLIYWLQEAEKWRQETFRKYPTPEAYDAACAALHQHRERADKAEQERRLLTQTMLKGDRIITELREDLETAEAREQKLREARPIDEWHEDYGVALWWTFPIEEPPYCGSPLDSEWPGYHTHWTPIVTPESAPLYPKEEEAK